MPRLGAGRNFLWNAVTHAVVGIGIPILFLGSFADAQNPGTTIQQTQRAQAVSQQQNQETTAPPCIEPPPLIRWQDYNGPFAKTVGVFARKLERKSVHPPHYKPGAVLCTLETKDKFYLFVQDTFDPVTFLSVGFDAGLDQAQNSDRSFGQGAAGYGKRSAPTLRAKHPEDFLRILPTLRCSQKTLDIIGWPTGASDTGWLTP